MNKLSDLKKGEEAIIESFETDELSIKFMEMGCVPGEKVTVEQLAANGDPISIKVSGYCLSLRISEAAQIVVKK
jgi:ferrous iron transport protein A